jgi:hypothetical protein
MCLAYAGSISEAPGQTQNDSIEGRRIRIFDRYIDRIFEDERAKESVFSRKKTLNWLSWLARGMNENSQPVFFVEDLQPKWLNSLSQRVLYASSVAFFYGMIMALFQVCRGLRGADLG